MSKKRFFISASIYDKRGRLISTGTNSYTKTHPLQARHASLVGLPEKQLLHAEIHAITRCKNLHKARRIVVTRYDKDGNPKNAKPCKVCMSAIKTANIKIIEYT